MAFTSYQNLKTNYPTCTNAKALKNKNKNKNKNKRTAGTYLKTAYTRNQFFLLLYCNIVVRTLSGNADLNLSCKSRPRFTVI